MIDLQNISTPNVAGDLLKALDGLQPCERHSNVALFAAAYPGIEQAIARGVTQKAIILELQRFNLKLHPARFKEMLFAERQMRDASGNRVYCETCGANLPGTELHQAEKSVKADGGEA